MSQYPGCSVQLAFEACGFSYEIAWWAAAQQIGVTVIAPSRMERAPGRQVKTDRLDVGTMARKLEGRALTGIYVPVGHPRVPRAVLGGTSSQLPFLAAVVLGGHPKPASDGQVKTGQS